jgi:hypothetical protein
VRFSRADITKAQTLLGYRPTCRVNEGLRRAFAWYVSRLSAPPARPIPAIVPTAGGVPGDISLVAARMGQASD